MSAVGSSVLAWIAKSDAEAINTAGSIRMATYRISLQIATDFAADDPFSTNLSIKQSRSDSKSDNQAEQQGRLDFSDKDTAEKVDILIEDMENRLEELQSYQLMSANRHALINGELSQIKAQWFQELKPALLAQNKQGFYGV